MQKADNPTAKIYLAVFYKENQAKVKTVYEIDPDVATREANRQLDNSKNSISHVCFSETWARRNGSVVYKNNDRDKNKT